jgi:crotonobetaine/carnitine-CoA ligase
VAGLTTPLSPTLGRDVRWLVDRWAAAAPARPFLTWVPFDGPTRSWTRAGFARDVAALVAAFRHRGLRPGDPLALVLRNHPDYLLAWTAAASMGAIAVCLNPDGSADELGYAGTHSGVRAAIADGDRVGAVARALPDLAFLAVGGDGARGSDSMGELLRTDPAGPGAPIPGTAAASVQYTSGTTARPKGVVWTQANCLWAGAVGAAHQDLAADDVNLVHLPLFHTNALSYSFLSTLWSGAQMVLMPKFSASRFWDVSVRHGVTWTSVVSFCLRALAGREAPPDHCYRGWGHSACLDPASVPGEIPAVGWFGMTETVTHPVVGGLLHPDRPGSMGRPAPEYEIAVLDDDGAPVVPDGIGELLVRGVRGVSLFAEYLHDADATARAFTDDGWFRTGDRVRLDPEGTLTFVERDKDVLKVGGENIGAPEIERALLAVPGVREAAVVGRPDLMLGEVPVAFVTVREGASVAVEDLQRSCAELLAAFKRPREVRIVDALPRSTLDKVAKAQLRALLAAETADG